MPKIIFIDPDNNEIEVNAEVGASLMEAAMAASVPGVEAVCGGNCVCATCHCFLEAQWYARIPPPNEDEAEMLDATIEVRPTSRLTCQITVESGFEGMRVEVSPSQH